MLNHKKKPLECVGSQNKFYKYDISFSGTLKSWEGESSGKFLNNNDCYLKSQNEYCSLQKRYQ